MKTALKVLAMILWVYLANEAIGPGLGGFVGGSMLLAIGLWAGYGDGKKAGRREMLVGKQK